MFKHRHKQYLCGLGPGSLFSLCKCGKAYLTSDPLLVFDNLVSTWTSPYASLASSGSQFMPTGAELIKMSMPFTHLLSNPVQLNEMDWRALRYLIVHTMAELEKGMDMEPWEEDHVD